MNVCLINRPRLLFVLISLATTAQPSKAQVIFYGGDFDGRNGSPSQWTPAFDALSFDDFDVPQTVPIGSIWGNFQMNFIPTEAYYQIRSGVSAGNGGTLLSSGTLTVQVTPTGLSQGGLPEYQVIGNVSLSLTPGRYWLSMAPVGDFFQSAYISTTSGEATGPLGDPNPHPTGSPLANGNSFFYDPNGYNFVPTDTTTLGPGTWDFSYGVAAVPKPATSTLMIFSAIAGLILQNRHGRGAVDRTTDFDVAGAKHQRKT